MEKSELIRHKRKGEKCAYCHNLMKCDRDWNPPEEYPNCFRKNLYEDMPAFIGFGAIAFFAAWMLSWRYIEPWGSCTKRGLGWVRDLGKSTAECFQNDIVMYGLTVIGIVCMIAIVIGLVELINENRRNKK